MDSALIHLLILIILVYGGWQVMSGLLHYIYPVSTAPLVQGPLGGPIGNGYATR